MKNKLAVCIAVGIMLGTAVGVVTRNIALCVGIGFVAGVSIGVS